MNKEKTMKKFISLLLAFVLAFSLSATAFAYSGLEDEFANFQYVAQGDTQNSFVRVLQRFLLNYNSTTANYISTNGGVDGSFGLGTYYATYYFQKEYFKSDASQWDGKVGSKTWKAIYHSMSLVDLSEEGTIYYFRIGTNNIVWKVSGVWHVKDKYGYNYSFTV